MNQVQLIGRLTKNIELRENSNQTTYCFFTIAVNEYRNGKEEPVFIDCMAYEKTAKNMANFLSSGSLVGVTGKISSRRNRDNNGNYQTITNVVADRVEFLESKNSSRSKPQTNNDQYVRNDSNIDMDVVNGFEQEETSRRKDQDKKAKDLFKDDDSILWD